MLLSMGLVLFVFGHFIERSNVFCVEHSIIYSGIQYEVISSKKTHEEAGNVCDDRRGYLAKLDQDHLQDQVETALSKLLVSWLPHDNPCFWIGLKKANFVMRNVMLIQWFNGSPVTDVRWRDSPHTCGVVCQQQFSENVNKSYWEWRPIACDAKLGFVCQYGCTDCVSPVGVSAVQYKGLHYTMYNVPKTYAHAEHFCQWNGGNLAKIDLDIIPDGQDTPLSRLVCEYVEKCTWIGMSDRKREGQPEWFDGSAVENVMWLSKGAFQWWYDRDFDCGLICSASFATRRFWKLVPCSDLSVFVCQYDTDLVREKTEQATTTTTRATTPVVTEITTEISLKSVPPKIVKRKAFRKSRNIHVTSPPLFQKTAMSVSMCLRICSEICEFFNFHVQTWLCVGFPGTSKIEGTTEEGWELWEQIYY